MVLRDYKSAMEERSQNENIELQKCEGESREYRDDDRVLVYR